MVAAYTFYRSENRREQGKELVWGRLPPSRCPSQPPRISGPEENADPGHWRKKPRDSHCRKSPLLLYQLITPAVIGAGRQISWGGVCFLKS